MGLGASPRHLAKTPIGFQWGLPMDVRAVRGKSGEAWD